MQDSKNETTFGFNKRRAEGKDGGDKPRKNPQLKVRRLNPSNTISYVQVMNLCFRELGLVYFLDLTYVLKD